MARDNSPDPFGSTRWNLVLAAGAEGTVARAALETLCAAYWLPVYGYVRSKVTNPDDAADLTQAFFAELLERKTLSAADPARGRFRAFLLTSLKHFLINEHARLTAQKRGGGRIFVAFDRDVAETCLAAVRPPARTPEQEYERRWALALLEQVLRRLEQEQEAAGRAEEFAVLRPFLTGEQQQTQADAVRALRSTPEAVRAAIYRLRKRYRQLLREDVAQTVASPADVEDELQWLVDAVGR